MEWGSLEREALTHQLSAAALCHASGQEEVYLIAPAEGREIFSLTSNSLANGKRRPL